MTDDGRNSVCIDSLGGSVVSRCGYLWLYGKSWLELEGMGRIAEAMRIVWRSLESKLGI